MQDENVQENAVAGYLTRQQLAKQLRKHPRTIQRWETERIGPPVARIGKTPVYRIESVREWLAANETPAPRRSGLANPAHGAARTRRAK